MAGICIFVLALAVGLETQGETVTVVRAFESGLSGVHARNDAVHLSVGTDPALPDERVLLVDYPVPGSDPAARDVRCEAETSDWSAGRAISFQIKPSHDLRLSVSLVDRNGVAYTTWVDLKENVWQAVRIAFDRMRRTRISSLRVRTSPARSMSATSRASHSLPRIERQGASPSAGLSS